MLRRGFKTEAEMIARDLRFELGIGSVDRLDPLRLAEYLSIPVIPLSIFEKQDPTAIKHFSVVEPKAFSAVTVFFGFERLIVHNDYHSNPRQYTNITHELSHAILLHPPTPPLSDHGCREWNSELEEEANWLSGTLLIPEEAALYIVRNGWTEFQAAQWYGISRAMIRFRLNVTGAKTRVNRSRHFNF